MVIACTAPTPRGVPAGEVAAAARRAGCSEVLVVDTPAEACRLAVSRSHADDAVLVAGSIYVVGEARAALLPGGRRVL
jgi:dihydrofolate synthase/folylpolyglutamate synthase